MLAFPSRVFPGIYHHRFIVFLLFLLICVGSFAQETLFPDQGLFPGTWVVNCGGQAWLVVWDSENYSPGWLAFRPGQDDIYITLTSRMPSGTIIWTISNPGGGVATDPVNPSTGLTLDYFRSAALYVLADAGFSEEDMASGRFYYTILDSSDFSPGWGDCTGVNPGLDCVVASIASAHVSPVTVTCTIWEVGLPFRVNGVLTLSTKNLTIRATMNCEMLSVVAFPLREQCVSCTTINSSLDYFLGYWLLSGSTATSLNPSLSCPPITWRYSPFLDVHKGYYLDSPSNLSGGTVLNYYSSGPYTYVVPLVVTNGQIGPYSGALNIDRSYRMLYVENNEIYICVYPPYFHKILSYNSSEQKLVSPYDSSIGSSAAMLYWGTHVVCKDREFYADYAPFSTGQRFFFVLVPAMSDLFDNNVSGVINQSITVDVQPITDLLQEIRGILRSQSSTIPPDQLNQLLSSIDDIESAIYEAQFADNVSDTSSVDSAADQVSSSINALRDALLQQQGTNTDRILRKLDSLNSMVSQFFSVQSSDLPDISAGYPGPDYSDANAWAEGVGESLQGSFSGLGNVFTAVFSRDITCGTWTIPIPSIAVEKLDLPDDSVTLDFNDGLLSLISSFSRIGTSVILLLTTLFGVYRLFFRSVTGTAPNSGGEAE